jgi:hypothetical protein
LLVEPKKPRRRKVQDEDVLISLDSGG